MSTKPKNEELENKDDSPEHIPVIPFDTQKEREKEEARKKARELRKSLGNIEPIIITKSGALKKAGELTLYEQEEEFLHCATDPIYFIETYLTIFDQTQGQGGMIVPFKLFEFQRELIISYKNNRFVVANKYRQAGVSTTTCAYIAWYVMFNRNRQVAIVADKLETARDELMNDVVEFIESCPNWLKPKTGRNSEKFLKDTQKLKIYDNNSKLGAFSSKGLRGYTPTLLFWDEVAWTEKGDKFWTSAKPTLQTGGSAIFVSTPSGLDAVFYKTFMGAREGENNFRPVELWWYNDPRYNNELAWLKNKGKENEIRLIDENWDYKKRIQMMDEGWEASSPWFEAEVRDANGDIRKIAQELLCVGKDSMITVRNKNTGIIENIKISNLYSRFEEQNNSCEYLSKSAILMDKKILIKILKSIENIEQYYTKGGTSKFNKKFPNLLNLINAYTYDIQIYASNKILEAKIKYLINYNGNVDLLKKNDRILIFEKSSKLFKEANVNSAQKQWNACTNELTQINELYDENLTRDLLKNNYKSYFGKSGNRKLLRKDKRLYLSLYHHTREFNSLNKNLNRFTYRLFFFVNKINIYCEIHNKLKFWKMINGNIIISCSKCSPKYPSKEWFLNKYGIKWKIYINKRKRKLGEIKTNSKNWYIKKFGNVLGNEKYINDVEKKMNVLSKLKANKFSVISQDLFWNIYNQLENKKNIYFHNLNQEFVQKIPSEYEYDKTVMMLDFKQGNNIIEYNGNYWHNSEKDEKRYKILKKMGFNVKIVTSTEFNRNNINKKIIDECINFLSC